MSRTYVLKEGDSISQFVCEKKDDFSACVIRNYGKIWWLLSLSSWGFMWCQCRRTKNHPACKCYFRLHCWIFLNKLNTLQYSIRFSIIVINYTMRCIWNKSTKINFLIQCTTLIKIVSNFKWQFICLYYPHSSFWLLGV